MKRVVARDIPLAEITLRRYERPDNLERRELIRKICLSVGLLQPGDSRDVVVDIFHHLLNSKKELSSEDIKNGAIILRKKSKLALRGVTDSNVRRQLKRLRDLYLVEKVKNNYRITEFEDLHHIFEERIEKFYLNSIVERVKDYFNALKE